MPDPHVTASGERFARDMYRIREAHGVAVEDIHRDTMISEHVIESFEQDGLFEHPTFNRVYLRSFVRSYATAIGVEPARALEELEQALKGDYANELAVEYLGEEPETPTPPPDEPADDAADDAESEETPPSTRASERSVLEYSVPERTAPEGAPEEPESSSGIDEYGGAPDGSQWGVWIGIGIVILILIAWMLIGVLRGSTSPPASEPEETSPTTEQTTDTMREEAARPADEPAESVRAEPPSPSATLGDTLYFTVIAQEPVRPIRIRRDDDLRRPYYIDAGQAALFPAQRQIILEEELGSIRLLVNGFEYPVDARTSNGRLVLTRDTVEAFLRAGPEGPSTPVVPADTHQVWGTGLAGGSS